MLQLLSNSTTHSYGGVSTSFPLGSFAFLFAYRRGSPESWVNASRPQSLGLAVVWYVGRSARLPKVGNWQVQRLKHKKGNPTSLAYGGCKHWTYCMRDMHPPALPRKLRARGPFLPCPSRLERGWASTIAILHADQELSRYKTLSSQPYGCVFQ